MDEQGATWWLEQLGYADVCRRLEAREAVTFLRLLPLLHRLAGSREGIAWFLGALLRVPVHVHSQAVRRRFPANQCSRLGENDAWCRLGRDWVLGDSVTEGYSRLRITVGRLAGAAEKRLKREGWVHSTSAGRFAVTDKLLAVTECVCPYWLVPSFRILGVRRRVARGWRLGEAERGKLGEQTYLAGPAKP